MGFCLLISLVITEYFCDEVTLPFPGTPIAMCLYIIRVVPNENLCEDFTTLTLIGIVPDPKVKSY